jgi:hypothetical protein
MGSGQVDAVNVGSDSTYYANAGDDYRLYAAPTDGTGGTRLTDMGVAQIGVAGGWVYFRGLGSDEFTLFRVRPDGTNLQRVK